MKTVSRDIPLSEITLRRYEKPSTLDRRELVKKLCLSIGLLQPGDSRDVIVDILCALLEARKRKRWLKAEEIGAYAIKLRAKKKLSSSGCALSNIRRQLLRLRTMCLVDKSKNRYRILEFSTLSSAFSEKAKAYLIEPALSRINEYLSAVDSAYSLTRKTKTLNTN
ncbi:MAG: hypothetical protein NTZ02_03655 [Candidatus Woesearchaeota archaeon]|nr:hypothetical protein [Candidatus Woesearchaeota archaeon]